LNDEASNLGQFFVRNHLICDVSQFSFSQLPSCDRESQSDLAEVNIVSQRICAPIERFA
jgi:hypothetical protein